MQQEGLCFERCDDAEEEDAQQAVMALGAAGLDVGQPVAQLRQAVPCDRVLLAAAGAVGGDLDQAAWS